MDFLMPDVERETPVPFLEKSYDPHMYGSQLLEGGAYQYGSYA